MPRFLLAAHPTVGHTSALRAIGLRLRAKGHAVGFAIARVGLPLAHLWPAPLREAAGLAGAIAADGFEVLPLALSPAVFWHAVRLPAKTGYEELGTAIEIFTAGLAAQARAIAAHTARFGADAVVGDYLMPAAMLGAAKARRPFAALYHSALPFPVEGGAPFGSRLPSSARGTAAWRAAEREVSGLSAKLDARASAAAKAIGVTAPP